MGIRQLTQNGLNLTKDRVAAIFSPRLMKGTPDMYSKQTDTQKVVFFQFEETETG